MRARIHGELSDQSMLGPPEVGEYTLADLDYPVMRLLVVEDEPRVASFLQKGLKEDGFAVDAAADGQQGLALAFMTDYDAIVLDLMLPELDGLTLLRELRGRGNTTPILILTARDSVEDRVTGLDAGADDYLVKPFALAELLARLRALLRRGGAETEKLQVADLLVDLRTRRVERQGRRIDLTPKEFALLEYLADHRDQVVTRSMIAEHVWDMSFDGGSNVIDVYIRYLRSKIDDPFEAKLIHTRRGIGYVLSEHP
jgi:two-component system copper resistance phosphate regulon response regulator CusR